MKPAEGVTGSGLNRRMMAGGSASRPQRDIPTPSAEQVALALRRQIKAEYPYLVDRKTHGKKISDAKLGAMNIKRMLEREFPDISFWMDGCEHTHGNGASLVCVDWMAWSDAPTVKQVNGMIQSKFSHEIDIGGVAYYDVDSWRCAFRNLFGSAAKIMAQAHQVSAAEEAQWSMQRLERKTPAADPIEQRRAILRF